MQPYLRLSLVSNDPLCFVASSFQIIAFALVNPLVGMFLCWSLTKMYIGRIYNLLWKRQPLRMRLVASKVVPNFPPMKKTRVTLDCE
jgi:hypothetical protein